MEAHPFQIPSEGNPPADIPAERTLYPYQDTFTSFSIYPALRFDNYSKIKGSNADLLTSGRIADLGANIWRDAKVGMYFSSREMLRSLQYFRRSPAGSRFNRCRTAGATTSARPV